MSRYCNLPIWRSPSSGPRSIKLGRDPSGNPLPSGGVWGARYESLVASFGRPSVRPAAK
jgi:hypothetical protein